MKRIILAGLAVTLAACGGDSSNPPPPATLAGVAAKGLVLNGTVTFEELAANGSVANALGTAYTNATTGAYNFTLPNNYTGGPIRLRVGPRAGGGSQMVCDVAGGCANPAGGNFPFGAIMPLSPTFEMQSIVPSATAGTHVNASITPFTHMAAARALAAGTVDRAAVLNALSEINQMVGLDVLAIAPVNPQNVDDNTTEEQRVYAAFLAGVGQLANGRAEAGFAARLDAALTSLADGFEDGQLVGGSDGVSAADIVAAVNNQGASIAGLNTSTLALITASITAATSSGTYNPEPTPTATAGPVGEARGLIADSRTFLTGFEELGQPAQAFNDEMTTAGTLTDERFATLFNRLSDVLEGLGTAADNPDFTGPGSSVTHNGYTFSMPAATGSMPVQMVITDNNVLDGITVSVTLNTGITATAWNAQMEAAEGAPFNLGSPNATFNGSIQTPQAQLEFTNLALSIGPLVSTTGDGPDRIDTLSLRGTVALTDRINGISFSGTGELDSVARPEGVPASEGLAITPSRVFLRGTFNGLRRQFTGEMSVTINNAADLDVTVDESADNFANATVAAAFTATFPNFGTSSVAVALNRTEFEAGNVRLTLTRSGRIFIITAANDGEARTFSIQNPAGIRLEMTEVDPDVWEGRLIVTNNNRVIGRVLTGNDGAPIVRYEDGTFESLM